jgi:DNA-binding NarL/FixJ family response regulator
MTSSDLRESRKRIFLVDDHPLVREWLGHLINRQTDLTLCGEAESASEAMQEIRRRAPDAVVVDISLGGSSGIELILEIKLAFPKVAVLVLSMHEESTYVERALRRSPRLCCKTRDDHENRLSDPPGAPWGVFSQWTSGFGYDAKIC